MVFSMSRDCEQIKRFVLGGKSHFEIVQKSLDGAGIISFEYKVSKADRNNMWYVSILNVPSKDFIYAGYLVDKGNIHFVQGKRGCNSPSDKPIRGLVWLLNRTGELPTQVNVRHFGKCAMCGRTLKDDKSVVLGLGSSCIKKYLSM